MDDELRIGERDETCEPPQPHDGATPQPGSPQAGSPHAGSPQAGSQQFALPQLAPQPSPQQAAFCLLLQAASICQNEARRFSDRIHGYFEPQPELVPQQLSVPQLGSPQVGCAQEAWPHEASQQPALPQLPTQLP
jgi:hypothetical protein